MDFRSFLISQCDRYGITGEELADLAGFTPQTWSKYRNERTDMSGDLLWSAMVSISRLAPDSEVAQVVDLIRRG